MKKFYPGAFEGAIDSFFFFCKVIILCIHSVIPWMCSKCLLSIPSRVGRAAGRKEALGRYMVATEEDCVYPYCSRANSL